MWRLNDRSATIITQASFVSGAFSRNSVCAFLVVLSSAKLVRRLVVTGTYSCGLARLHFLPRDIGGAIFKVLRDNREIMKKH